jgi:protocatechuate 3,4-dioxygenase beta subunit
MSDHNHHHEEDFDPRIIMGPVPPEIHRLIAGISRRKAVQLMSLAGLASLVGCGSSSATQAATSTSSSTTTTTTSSTSCTAGSSTTQGPYWVDGDTASPNRTDIRPDTITTTDTQGTVGIPLTLSLAIYSYASSGCTPLQNARVDIWHADAVGVYSEEATQNETSSSTLNENFLRGYQLSDSSGLVSFTTIWPGWYGGRTAHIHIRVRTYDSSGNVLLNSTTQLFFDDSVNDTVYATANYTRTKTRDTLNTADSIYKAALQLTVSGSVTAGYTASLYGIGLPFGS